MFYFICSINEPYLCKNDKAILFLILNNIYLEFYCMFLSLLELDLQLLWFTSSRWIILLLYLFRFLTYYYYSFPATLRPYNSTTTKPLTFRLGMNIHPNGGFKYFEFQVSWTQGSVSVAHGAKINGNAVPTELLFRSAWNLVGVLFSSWQSADSTFGIILTLTFVIKTWVNIEQNVWKCITQPFQLWLKWMMAQKDR